MSQNSDVVLDADMQLGAIVAQYPSASAVFESIRLNYWSRGKRRLGVACKDQGLDPEQILVLLRQQILASSDASARDWSKATLADMVHFIVDTMHRNERREMDRIENLIKVVMDEYRNSMPQIRLLYEEFLEVKRGDNEHMDHEESLLFPVVEQIQEAMEQEKLPAPIGSVATPIRRTEYEHDLSSIYFKRLRDATESYRLPESPTENLKELYTSLQNFEANLHRHLHFENWILHPAAIRAEAKVLAMQF